MKDKDYLEGLLKSDDKVLRAIYKNFSSRISTHIQQQGGTPEDAKDVFQDALMIIFNKSQSTDFELTSSFYTYLFSICKLTWYAKKRKKSRQTVTISDDNALTDSQSIEQELLDRESDNIYRENFQKLGAFCQKLLRLFFEKKNMTEITKALQLKNEHTARNRKYRCSQNLKKLMEKDERYQELMSDK